LPALLSHMCCMSCPSHPPWLDHSNNDIWRRVHVMKFLTVQYSPTSHYLISLEYKYYPQSLVLRVCNTCILCNYIFCNFRLFSVCVIS
jgi:hypothetical protein